MHKKSAFSLAAALIVSPVITPAVAADCTQVELHMPVAVQTPATGPYPVVVATESMKVDTAKKSICYSFQGNTYLNTKISPEKFCVNIGAPPSTNDKEVSIVYANGRKLDISDNYGVEGSTRRYTAIVQSCENAKGDAPAGPQSAPAPSAPGKNPPSRGMSNVL